jgi:hypothetical protein
MRFEVLTAASIILALSWVLALCGFNVSVKHAVAVFRVEVTSALNVETACFSETLASTYETTWLQSSRQLQQ